MFTDKKNLIIAINSLDFFIHEKETFKSKNDKIGIISIYHWTNPIEVIKLMCALTL